MRVQERLLVDVAVYIVYVNGQICPRVCVCVRVKRLNASAKLDCVRGGGSCLPFRGQFGLSPPARKLYFELGKVQSGRLTHTLVYIRGFNEKPVRCAALLNIVVIMFHVRHNFVCVRVMFNPIGRVLESIRVCHGV